MTKKDQFEGIFYKQSGQQTDFFQSGLQDTVLIQAE